MDYQKSSGWEQVPFTPQKYLLTKICQQLSRQRPERMAKEPNHVANDPCQVVYVRYVRDSGVVSVEVLDSQLPKHWTFCQQMGTVSYSASQSGQRRLYRAVNFAKMIIETSMSSQSLSGRSNVSLDFQCAGKELACNSFWRYGLVDVRSDRRESDMHVH